MGLSHMNVNPGLDWRRTDLLFLVFGLILKNVGLILEEEYGLLVFTYWICLKEEKKKDKQEPIPVQTPWATVQYCPLGSVERFGEFQMLEVWRRKRRRRRKVYMKI